MKLNITLKEIITFLIIALLIGLIPFSLIGTRNVCEFINTGEIGDTIGGITAPFISFFAAVLVYLALKAQIDANDKIQSQFEEQNLKNQEDSLFRKFDDRIKFIINEINNFYYSSTYVSNNGGNKRNFEGLQAINELFLNATNTNKIVRANFQIDENDKVKLNEFKRILDLFNSTFSEFKTTSFNLTKESKLKDNDSKDDLKRYFEFIYFSKIEPIINNFKKNEKLSPIIIDSLKETEKNFLKNSD